MDLAEARALKQSLLQTIVLPEAALLRSSSSTPTRGLDAVQSLRPTMALGVAPGRSRSDYRIALRIQDRLLEHSQPVEQIRQHTRGELDERFIGTVRALVSTNVPPRPWQQQRHRQLRLGVSVGHVSITAGTLGGFVRRRGEDAVYLLSNNHVLAPAKSTVSSNAILQPGSYDGGMLPDDHVADLAEAVPLLQQTNAVDAAIARLRDEIDYDPRTLEGIGTLAGVGMADVDQEVKKLGRTSGPTHGRVTAIELEGVVADYEGLGLVRFDGQLEIQGDDRPFSSGGDSGSLIVDSACRAVGLLFAGTDSGVTYANPIDAVLNTLQVEFVL